MKSPIKAKVKATKAKKPNDVKKVRKPAVKKAAKLRVTKYSVKGYFCLDDEGNVVKCSKGFRSVMQGHSVTPNDWYATFNVKIKPRKSK